MKVLDEDDANYGGAESKVSEEKGKKKHQLQLTDKHRQNEAGIGVSKALKNFLVALWVVLRNPIYTGCLVGRFFDTIAWKGLFVFLPKYLESHYGMPQFKANLYLAVMGVIGFALGVVIGSIVMRVFKLEGRRAAGYIGVISLIGVGLSFVNIGLGCTSVNNRVGKMGVERNFSFTNGCNKDCNCGPVSIFPVCSDAGTAYFSPCVAGCKNMTIIDKMSFRFNFTECDCIDNGTVVTRDNCQDDCGPMLTAYFIISVVGGLFAGSSVIPSILVVLRMFGFQGALRCVGFLFDIFVFYHAKHLKLMDGVEEQEEANAHKNRRNSSRAETNGFNAALEAEAEKLGSISSLHDRPLNT